MAAIFPPGVYPTLPATTFVLELNPGPESKYQIRDVGPQGSPTPIFVDLRYGDPLDNNSAFADVFRRARKYQGAPQALEIGPGCTFNKTFLGGQDTNKDTTIYWAPSFSSPISQFEPVRDVHVYARDPIAGRPRLNGWEMSARAQNNSGGSGFLNHQNGKTHGPVTFRGIDIHSNGGEYCIHSAIGERQSFGKFGWYDTQLVGEAGSFQASGFQYDCDMFMRAAYGQWELIDVTAVGAAREHFCYVDAMQGDSIFANCFCGPGLVDAPGNGRTMFQFVQRGDEGSNQNGPIEGSNELSGFGTIWVCNNVAQGCGRQGGHAYTFVGHLGEIRLIDNQALDCESGAYLFWSDWAKGLWTTAGLFLVADPLNPKLVEMPISGTAFNYGKVIADGMTATQAVPWPSSRTPVRFAGIADLEIGAFDIDMPDANRTMWFWQHNTSNNALDPLDNGNVKFLGSKVGATVSSYPGWVAGATKATYGSQDNNNQPQTGGAIPLATLNAMVDDDAGLIYPPWPQAGPGTINPSVVTPNPLVLSLSIPVVTATQPATIVVTPDPLVLSLSAPDVGVSAPITVSITPPLRLGLRFSNDLAVVHDVTVRPSPLRLRLTLPPVSAAGGPIVLVPDPLVLSLSTPAVSTLHPITIAPTPLSAALSMPAVAAQADALVTPDPLVLSLSTPVVGVQALVSVQPDPLRMGLRTPLVSVNDDLFVGPAPLVLSLSAPTVAAISPAIVTPDPLALRLTVPPVAIGGEFIQIAPLVLTLLLPETPIGDAPAPITFEVVLLASATEIDTDMATAPPVWSGTTVNFVGVFKHPSGALAGEAVDISGTTIREILLQDPNGGPAQSFGAAVVTDGADGKIQVERPLTLAGDWKMQAHVSGGGLDLFSAVVQFTVQHSLQT